MKSEQQPSFEKINYLLRPRKQIERKILIELFLRVRRYKSDFEIEQYHYIGMGSIFYYDFILFHKYLNIRQMTSIDANASKKRFHFNKPFDFIHFENLETTDYLEKHDFRDPVIIWLDYDSAAFKIINDEVINNSVFDDLRIISDKCHAHDFVIVTVNVKPPSKLKDYQLILKKYKPYISTQFENKKQINQANFHLVVQDILLNFIAEEQKFKEAKFRKLFSFYYNDSAPMLSIGGILDSDDRLQKLLSTERFAKTDRKINNINVPILTYREKMYLDSMVHELMSQMGKMKTKRDFEKLLESLKFEIESIDVLKSYVEYYRYYPQYYEGIV